MRPGIDHARVTSTTAVTQHRYGSAEVLDVEEITVPPLGPEDVLIEVRAASVNPADWHRMTGTPFLARIDGGLMRPKEPVLGSDVAGVVLAVGPDVTVLAPGDRVVAQLGRGGFAGHVVAAASRFVAIPDAVSFEQAAALPIAGLTALQALRDRTALQPGDRVLINGASGGVGTFAVQIARALGAASVTGVCSTGKVDLVRSLGADRVIDYTVDDYTLDEARYDVIVDNVGNRSLRANRRLLVPSGRYVMVSGPKWPIAGPLPKLLAAAVMSRFVPQTLSGMLATGHRGDLLDLTEMVASGEVEPVIERTLPLREVSRAMHDQGEFRARGKTVIVP